MEPVIDEDEIQNNPYMALRAAKIARNQARLKELGLWKPTTPAVAKKRSVSPSTASNKRPSISNVISVPTRRSSRISKHSNKQNYVESDIKDNSRSSSSVSTSRPTLEVDKDVSSTNDSLKYDSPESTRLKRRTVQTTRVVTPPVSNSVKTITLDPIKLAQKFLGKPMDQCGKEYVIYQSFEHAASTEDVDRLNGISRLSFNKYSGVQTWKNVAFLWINIGSPNHGSSGAIVNDFLDDGKSVTWFGGSNMEETSSIIQWLLQVGKSATKNKDHESSSLKSSTAIILWCRLYQANTKKFGPYVCLGRLAYESHIPQSYPVMFIWRLLDYGDLMKCPEQRRSFQEIITR